MIKNLNIKIREIIQCWPMPIIKKAYNVWGSRGLMDSESDL